MSSPEEWYHSLPTITKGYLTTAFLTTCGCSLGFLSPHSLYLDYNLVWYNFQIWRLVTCFVYLGGFSFNLVIKLYILAQYSSRLESNPFYSGGGSTADYAYMLVIGGSVMWVIGYFFGFHFLGSSMIFMIVYIWSRREPDSVVSIYGFTLKGIYLPWGLMAFTVLIGGSPIMDLVGVVSGHIYYFLQEVLPNTHNIHLIKTPEFMSNMFPTVGLTSGSQQAPRQEGAANTGPARHSWGTGRTLGSSN